MPKTDFSYRIEAIGNAGAVDEGIKFLPYRKASEETKRLYEEIMRTGNVPLRKWYELAQQRQRLPHQRYGRTRFRQDILKEVRDRAKRVTLYGVTIPKSDIKKILDVLNLESNILMAYSRMAKSEALKWSKRSQDRAVALPDLYTEACMVLRKSIHYFTKKGRFTTYAHWNIKRRMIAICNRATSLSEMPAATIELRQLYDETKAGINGPCTFQQVVEMMGISSQQVGTLRASLVLVFSQDALAPYHEDRDVSDFSTAGSSVFNGMDGDEDWRVVARRGRSPLHPVFAPQEEVPVADLYTFLSQVIFSDFEQKVLDGFFQDSQTGWQTRLAASMINPDTDEPYTRAAVSQAWKKIILKLQEVAGTNE